MMTKPHDDLDPLDRRDDLDLLYSIVTLDHQQRLMDRQNDLMPTEVIVLLSMAAADTIEDRSAKDVLNLLPTLGRNFFTVQGSFLVLDKATVIEDTQTGLLKALKRSPDGDYVPLALSVLERAETQSNSGRPVWTGIISSLTADMVFECSVEGEECRLRKVSPDFAAAFVAAASDTIQTYRDYVSQLD